MSNESTLNDCFFFRPVGKSSEKVELFEETCLEGVGKFGWYNMIFLSSDVCTRKS